MRSIVTYSFVCIAFLGMRSFVQAQSVSQRFPTLSSPSHQVTSITQLTDVKPTDWAFQAVQRLQDRYNCLTGYPDQTFQGKRTLTRYEFASGLYQCTRKITESIGSVVSQPVSKEDWTTVEKLEGEFATELAVVKSRVAALTDRVILLEKQSFSPTTKLEVSTSFVFGYAE